MNIIRVETTNNVPNTFYKVLKPLAYYRIPSKTLISEGVMDIKPFNQFTMESIKQALNELKVKFTEVEE